MNTSRTALVISGVLACAAASPAIGALTFTSQVRQVRAELPLNFPPVFDEHFAPDFGAWLQTATLPGTGASATMDCSAITAASVIATLRYGAGSRSILSNAFAKMTLNFTVDSPTEYDFLGHMYSLGQWGLGQMTLTGPLGVVFQFQNLLPIDFVSSGVLTPGQYTFYAEGSHYPNNFQLGQSGTVEFTMRLPTPGGALLLAIGGLLAQRRRR